MKRLLLSAALLVLVAGCSQNNNASSPGTSSAPATQASAKPINTHCAVDTGDEVDPKVTYLYQGKTIGFCCEKCIDEFKKDPEKYMKTLK